MDGKATRSAEDPDREAKRRFEDRISGMLLALWREQLQELRRWLEKAGSKDLGDDLAANEEFWASYEESVLATILPELEEIVEAGGLAAAEALEAELAVGVDWTLVNPDAMRWAREYGYELVSGITETTRAQLQEAIANWIASGEPLPDLIGRVEAIFDNPVRAEMIGVTETTRAYAEGNMRAWRASEVVKGRQWQTAADELVCPICAPLQDMVRMMDADFPEGGPPAHVNCRCWIVPVVK